MAAPAAHGLESGYRMHSAKNHIKALVVDGEVACISDRNLGESYFGFRRCEEVWFAGLVGQSDFDEPR